MREAATMALRSVPRAALALPPVWRRRLAALLAGLIVLASIYWLWFRDSSFVRVHEVEVTGVSGPQARAIRSALVDAGLDQTTLHVSTADLRAAVGDFPVVRSVTAQGDFPHKLRVQVELNMPVAILKTPSGRRPVAADGLFLPDVPVSGSVPVLTTKAVLPAKRVTAGAAFDLVRVVGIAPEPLRVRIQSVGFKPGTGIVAKLTAGPDLIFGDAARLPAKWMAAARVLAAAGARGAGYIDLRLPERPAAGGLAITTVLPLAPAGETAAPVTPPASPTSTTTTPATTGQTPAGTTPAQPAATTGQTPAQNPQAQVQSSPQP
jgi:cell division protein FtsQ